MSTPTVPLYARLPEIYRQRDTEQQPPGQLQAYLALVENVFGTVHDNIGAPYPDLFIGTCAPWVFPYIDELLRLSVPSRGTGTPPRPPAHPLRLRPRERTIHAIQL